MQFIISADERQLAQITSEGDHALTVQNNWDGHSRVVSPMEALRLLVVAMTDGLRVDAYPSPWDKPTTD